MKSKNIGKIWIAVTAVIVLAAVASFTQTVVGWGMWGIVSSLILGILIANFSALLWILKRKWQEKKAGLAIEDERTQFLAGRAALRAFLVGQWFILGLLWYDWFWGHGLIDGPELNTAWALILSILANSGLFLLLRWYYGRKEAGL